MKKMKTISYHLNMYQCYITVYQDLLGRFYYTYYSEDTSKRYSIKLCSESDVINFYRYPECKTHYIDPAGNLISVIQNEKD
jgi:hypothetical protein